MGTVLEIIHVPLVHIWMDLLVLNVVIIVKLVDQNLSVLNVLLDSKSVFK